MTDSGAHPNRLRVTMPAEARVMFLTIPLTVTRTITSIYRANLFRSRHIMIVTVMTGLFTGCASTSENPWDSIDDPREPVQHPLQLPLWPIPETFDTSGATFTVEQLRVLDLYKTTAEANTAIAVEHAQQVEVLQEAVVSLVDAGQAQRTIAEMRKEMLEEERRHNFFKSIGLYAIIIAMGFAL